MGKHEIFTYRLNIAIGHDRILSHIKIGEPIETLAARVGKSNEEMAAQVLQTSRKDSRICETEYKLINAEAIKDIAPTPPEVIHGITIRQHDRTLNYDYYIYPEGQCLIILHRHDDNTGENFANEFFVPSNIFNMDCTGNAMQELFRQIAEEYCAEKSLDELTFTWHDFVQIPNEFMHKYGVKQNEHSDIMADITVTANESMLHMDGDSHA